MKLMSRIGYRFNPPPSIRKLKDRVDKLKFIPYRKHYSKQHNVLRQMHNLYNGRIFIVCTAPSLNKTNISLLKNETVFGMNTLFRAVDRIGKVPEFWGVSDVNVFREVGAEIMELDTMLFLTGEASLEYIKNKEDYNSRGVEPILIPNKGRMNYWNRFGYDLTQGIYGGRTVTIDACIQPAIYMGFDEIYLVALDFDYTKGHHFDGKEHGHVKEKEGGLPIGTQQDRQRLIDSYSICRKHIEGHGKKIFNVTIGGRLEVFERKKLEDVINGKQD